MLSDFAGAERVYGYTDLQRGIDGLAELTPQQYRWLIEGPDPSTVAGKRAG